MSELQRVISMEGLTKSYSGRAVLNGLSFEVGRGEVFALLGQNGAGKTTAIEILEGYRRPDAGSATVLGLDPVHDARHLKPRMGVILQDGGLYPGITPVEAVALFSHFYDNPLPAEDILDLVGLSEAATVRYRRLSGGQRQRLALALALLPSPEVVFLDEPTAGLDPRGRRQAWDVISSLKDVGCTVMLTTHYLEEAERLADHVGILKDGILIADGSPQALMQRGRKTVRLRTAGPTNPSLLAALPSAEGIHEEAADNVLIDTSDAPSLLVEITGLLQNESVPIVELRVGYGSLEEAFFDLTDQDST
jgi:ABC-2 type transport system ATP-binding protein